MNKQNQILIQVSSNGQIIGRMTAKEFMEYMEHMPTVKGKFLAARIKEFNEWKERIGEPERVEQILNK